MPDLSTTLWLFTAAFAASALGGVLGIGSVLLKIPAMDTAGNSTQARNCATAITPGAMQTSSPRRWPISLRP